MGGTRFFLTIALSLLLMPAGSRALEAPVETAHLVVTDATGKLSSGRLKKMADDAQETLNKVLSFWSADPGVSRFGKIRLVFDQPRRDVYSSVFYWEKKGGMAVRVVQVFGTAGAPQMMAHKLTSAIFPQKDKLIRNMMGILSEAQVGNPLTFPMCGFGSDDWVTAFLENGTYIPLGELGPDHESWGMRDAGGGKLTISDKSRQHKAYAEAGSFAEYLFKVYGIGRIKKLQRLSQERDRPWPAAFGADLRELETGWIASLRASQKTRGESVSVVLGFFDKNPSAACLEAQKAASAKR